MNAQPFLFADVKVESKTEARERARQIIKVLGAIDDVPVQTDIMEGQMMTCEYFIERGQAGKMTVDDWDGFGRNIGDLDEILTPADRRSITRDREHWKPVPTGYLGASPGRKFYTKLHPKELALLQQWRTELADLIAALQSCLPEWEAELAELRSVGPLPPDIAERYNLTPEGARKINFEK